jgi:hypothetical protein
LASNLIFTDGQLQTLDLTNAAFQGPSVKIVARRDPVLDDDGFVNVGYINASQKCVATIHGHPIP